MGQKSNITTVRSSFKNFNFLNQNSQSFYFIFVFKELVNRLFAIKGVLIADSVYNFVNNQLFCVFKAYIRYSKLRFYKKKKYKKQVLTLKNNKGFKKLFGFVLRILKTNLVVLKFLNLNLLLNKKLLNHIYLKTKYTKKTLFARRYFLFMDFLGVSALFVQGFVKTSVFLKILGEIFRVLPSRRHTFFLKFVKSFLQSIIVDNIPGQPLNKSKITGVKLTLSGKIQGKSRSSTSIILVGSVPIQSIDKNIEYSRLHVYTVYGSYGMKMWVFKNK